MAFENTETGSLEIYDWKRVREIKYDAYQNKTSIILDNILDTNYWHYAVQLTFYTLYFTFYILHFTFTFYILQVYCLLFSSLCFSFSIYSLRKKRQSQNQTKPNQT
jgi:hypothetical protein